MTTCCHYLVNVQLGSIQHVKVQLLYCLSEAKSMFPKMFLSKHPNHILPFHTVFTCMDVKMDETS